jgi:tetratricopeptide (TPR) repeat protein
MIISPQNDLNIKELEKFLLENIYREVLPDVQLQLSCLVQENNLVILLHAPANILPQQTKLWRSLKQSLLQQEITQQILVYLILQDRQPAQIITHSINLSGADSKTFNPRVFTRSLFKSNTTSIILPQVSDKTVNRQQDKSLFPANFLRTLAYNKQAQLIAGGGLSLIFFLTLGYALSRPCVLGSCEVIPQAQQLAANSAKIYSQQPTLEQLAEIRQELLESIRLLKTIPLWSSSYQKASQLIKSYTLQLEELERVITGIDFAKQAHLLTKNAPLTVVKWQEVKGLWQKAIATLGNISARDSSGFTRYKIEQYQGNIAYTNQQIKLEQQSQENLKSAQEAIKIAQARQSVSQTLANWRLAEATWRTAINKLKAISPATTSYQLGKDLLTKYEPKLLESVKKRTEEEKAVTSYNQALEEAKLAKEAELLNQWSVSVAHWRNAVTHIKQIPSNSSQYVQSQTLTNSYTKSFEESQVKLRAILKLQNANNELEKVCSGPGKICNYVIRDNTIQVHLTPAYVRDVWQSALEAKAQGNLTNQVRVLNNISTLEKSLETISKNTGLAVEVYNSDGVLMLTYKPQKGS